ncbi:hypothetical protein GFS31_31120 [Leptolyngbya sp. BL0902]|uniref:hypothetical protein n=1 Tax=Leptolyngbya sp. BL0902 TaxID=1115757 RepID=UPI0018E86D11|nr:hypothetical protein [Leptolyngbya sp. BL0902]QQE66414.1 hypothetical protein GFS31_31120 [Leptolyngbya sp. BL0902]
MMSSFSASSSANADDADYVLGQTGDTVVYIFPTGHALMNRDTDNASAALVEYQQKTAPNQPQPPATASQPTDPSGNEEESALIDQLLADGKVTVAQIQVARYDQSVTGMSLAEALTLRGWL